MSLSICLCRSPGGTPLRPKVHRQQEPSMEDPAAVIAHALRKKFSHKIFQDSPGLLFMLSHYVCIDWHLWWYEMIFILPSSDKENLDRSESSFNEFNSPGPSTKLVNLQQSVPLLLLISNSIL